MQGAFGLTARMGCDRAGWGLVDGVRMELLIVAGVPISSAFLPVPICCLFCGHQLSDAMAAAWLLELTRGC